MNRRELDLRDFDSIVAEVDRLLNEGYTKVGQWNLAQTCRHLVLPLNGSIDGFNVRGPWLIRKLARLVAWKSLFVKRQIKPGIKAPASFQFNPDDDDREAVEAFKKALERFRNHQGEFHRHPIFDDLTPEQWVTFHQTHICHHLRFLIPADRNSGPAQPGD